MSDPLAKRFGFEILCDDGPLLAVNKPPGVLTQGVPGGIDTLERRVKAYLKERYNKPGNVYLGIPHRLDRPVSGVIVFARNSKAARRLAEQFQQRQVHKQYWAVTERTPETPAGRLVDWLLKWPEQARVEVVPPETPGAREAILHYRVLQDLAAGCLVEVSLETGRMHQIRVQLASRGWPIVGDFPYGAATSLGDAASEPRTQMIALHARRLTILHPVRYQPLTLTARVPEEWGQLGMEKGDERETTDPDGI